MGFWVHESAEVSPSARLGNGVKVWAFSQVREGAVIGDATQIGSHSYVDFDVQVGKNCKIQSGVLLFHGTTLGDGVFVGPGAIVANDLRPRAINPDGTLKAAEDWAVAPVHIGTGASLGAGSIVIPGVTVGGFSLVAAGAVVTRDVPPHGLVVGSPARLTGWVCCCGEKLEAQDTGGNCPACQRTHPISSP